MQLKYYLYVCQRTPARPKVEVFRNVIAYTMKVKLTGMSSKKVRQDTVAYWQEWMDGMDIDLRRPRTQHILDRA